MQTLQRRRPRRDLVPSRAAMLGAVIMLFPLARSAGAQRARADSVAASVTLLGDVYDGVQRANPRIAAARQLTRAAQARVPGASRPPDPQLQLGFMNYTLPGLAPMATIGMTQLQLMQMVPLGGKLRLAGRAAEAEAAATEEREQDVAWELRNQAAMAFYDLYATDRQLGIARETLRLLQEIALNVESMYRVGQGRQADVLRARVEIARMTEDTLRMRAMRESMVAKLNALLDRDARVEIGALALPAFREELPAREWMDSVASNGRPMIRAGEKDVRAADARARLAGREIVPDLQVGVQYAQRGSDMPEGGTERMGSLMLGASIPIFARDRQLQMRNEATAMREMAAADLSAMRAETRGRIGESYAALSRARTLERLYRTTIIPQSEAAVTSAMSAYRAGTVDFMTLLDDRMIANRYRQELATLEADEGKAWAELEMLTGRTLLDARSVAPSAAPRGER